MRSRVLRLAPAVAASCVFAFACASTKHLATGDVGATESLSTARVHRELQYVELDLKARQALTGMARRFGREDLSRETTLEKLSGDQAKRMLDAAGKSLGPDTDAFLAELLSIPGAIAVQYRMPADPGLPTGALFIPYPTAESFKLSPDDDPETPGALFLFGLDDQLLRRASAPADRSKYSYPRLTQARLDDALLHGTKLVVFIHSPGCSGSEKVAAAVAKVVGEDRLETVGVYADLDGEFAGRFSVAYIGTVIFPTLMFFSAGRLEDIQIGSFGADKAALVSHFLTRNGVISGATARLPDLQELAGEPELLMRTLSVVHHVGAVRLDGADLSGLRLRRGSLSGSSLRAAKLAGADLRAAIFSRVDLTGADLRDANVEGSVWLNCVCPDGTSSTLHPDGCSSSASSSTLGR